MFFSTPLSHRRWIEWRATRTTRTISRSSLPSVIPEQILPGTFEYTLGYVIDHELDLSVFDGRYRNDEGGAPAYDPRILLKIILFAYSRGVVSSRRIENPLPRERGNDGALGRRSHTGPRSVSSSPPRTRKW